MDIRQALSKAKQPCLQTQRKMRLGAAMRAVVGKVQMLALSLTSLRQRALAPWRLELVQRAWTISQALKGQLPMVSRGWTTQCGHQLEWLWRTALLLAGTTVWLDIKHQHQSPQALRSTRQSIDLRSAKAYGRFLSRWT